MLSAVCVFGAVWVKYLYAANKVNVHGKSGAILQWQDNFWTGRCFLEYLNPFRNGISPELSWIEVLPPSQPIRAMSSRSVYLTTLYLTGLSSKLLNSTCAHSFTRNWQLPFLNQQKGENDCRIYFMINLHKRVLPDPVGKEPTTLISRPWSPVGHASDWRKQFSAKEKTLGF